MRRRLWALLPQALAVCYAAGCRPPHAFGVLRIPVLVGSLTARDALARHLAR